MVRQASHQALPDNAVGLHTILCAHRKMSTSAHNTVCALHSVNKPTRKGTHSCRPPHPRASQTTQRPSKAARCCTLVQRSRRLTPCPLLVHCSTQPPLGSLPQSHVQPGLMLCLSAGWQRVASKRGLWLVLLHCSCSSARLRGWAAAGRHGTVGLCEPPAA